MAEKLNPKQRPLVGVFWYCFAVFAGFGVMVGGSVLVESWGVDPGPGLIIAGLGVGALFWSLGSRHFATLGEDVLKKDNRPPIVYLRSFQTEASVFEEEYAFSKMFEEIGPFVAIGEPGERLPPLGAARLYVSDDDWQNVVAGLVAKARLVIVYGGRTPGLGWELDYLKRHVNPLKLAIMMPNNESAYQSFRELCRSKGGFDVPGFPEKKLRKYSSAGVAGFVAFNSSWQSEFVSLPKVKGRGFGVNVYGDGADGRAWVALAKICERAGIAVKKPPRNWFVSVYRALMKVGAFIFFFVFVPLLVLLYLGVLVDDGNNSPTFDWAVLEELIDRWMGN